MTRALDVHQIGPGATLQDQGRPGYLVFGVSRGGAVDSLALAEGAALLGQAGNCAALEMPGMGGVFEAQAPTRIALTGAPMRANIDGARIVWNACHLLEKGAKLTIGGTETGSYGYLHVGGGFDAPVRLDARSVHLSAGIGEAVKAGDRLDIGEDRGTRTGVCLDVDSRFDGGVIRVLSSLQTAFFSDADLDRFEATIFRRDTRGNRMGVRVVPDGSGFESAAGLSVLSEIIVPGDIQVTGDGTPFVLLAECQTTGGYPRIGSVLPEDLPRVVQAPAGSTLRFKFVGRDEAIDVERRGKMRREKLRSLVRPLVRSPENIANLLSYQLISGVTAGDDLD